MRRLLRSLESQFVKMVTTSRLRDPMSDMIIQISSFASRHMSRKPLQGPRLLRVQQTRSLISDGSVFTRCQYSENSQ